MSDHRFNRSVSAIREFLHHESFGGILLIFAAGAALFASNSWFAPTYGQLLSTPGAVQIGEFIIQKPLLLWINDGLMAIFFFLIGLEIKREVLEGELSSFKQASLPIVAALGGLAVPALIYTALNAGDTYAMRGWGVPIATDIAFALGILSLVGSKAPSQLKILLLSLAIIDDIAAVLIIALFYTENLSPDMLIWGGSGFLAAILCNLLGIKRITPYVLIGIFMWACVLKSGVHATIAGVLIALCVPLKGDEKNQRSPLNNLEHTLHPWVAYFIMPIFAFANAGIALRGLKISDITEPLPLGILLGLFAGKQIGVFGAIFLAVKLKFCQLPAGVGWQQIYGLACLCGIGFTMSLFIGTLAFEDPVINAQMRLSILCASGISALLGYAVLRWAKPLKADNAPTPG